MDDAGHRKLGSVRGDSLSQRRSWCCSFAVPPSSPDTLSVAFRNRYRCKGRQNRAKPDHLDKPGFISVPSSPQSSKSGLNIVGRIDPRRILSPGRVSPIDSDPAVASVQGNAHDAEPVADLARKSRSQSFRALKVEVSCSDPGSGPVPDGGMEEEEGYDARLSLKGRNGGVLVLELSSAVLSANSEVFADLIAANKKGSSSSSSLSPSGLNKVCRLEVRDVKNLGIFRETIELMFNDRDTITKKMIKLGVYRAIDILEVAAGIKFTRAVMSCLRYLEAVPWTEEEEEKLRRLLMMFNFDVSTTREILARLDSTEAEISEQSLSKQLVWSITSCTDVNARQELKSLVKGLLSKSSVYEKEQPELKKEDIYVACQSCLDLLAKLFEEASSNSSREKVERKETGKEKPLIERVSRQVDNINWLLEIMIDGQIAEEFVELWAKQIELAKMHEKASPMVRYELSRVSGVLFIAIGNRKLQCRSEARAGLVEAWFGPMLVDFGWLQRCKKGLDVKQVEEGLGRTLLTLPLRLQHPLFMEWFRWFSKHGSECPNLSKAFQIWWRRSFLGSSETHGVESR